MDILLDNFYNYFHLYIHNNFLLFLSNIIYLLISNNFHILHIADFYHKIYNDLFLFPLQYIYYCIQNQNHLYILENNILHMFFHLNKLHNPLSIHLFFLLIFLIGLVEVSLIILINLNLNFLILNQLTILYRILSHIHLHLFCIFHNLH